ncbi:MAG: flagellar basal body rod protein FlgC [Legionellales bacterium]
MTHRLDNILGMMASSMSAESIRMNITASNLANASSVGPSDAETYHAKHPVFSTIIASAGSSDESSGGVRVSDIKSSTKPLSWRSDPENPLSGSDGHIFVTDVNPIEEMTDMIAASRQYQAAAEVTSTTKNLLMQTIRAIEN